MPNLCNLFLLLMLHMVLQSLEISELFIRLFHKDKRYSLFAGLSLNSWHLVVNINHILETVFRVGIRTTAYILALVDQDFSFESSADSSELLGFLVFIIEQLLLLNLFMNCPFLVYFIMSVDFVAASQFTLLIMGIFLAGFEIVEGYVYEPLVEIGFICTHIELFLFLILIDDFSIL